MLHYFRSVADRSSLPVILYNIPKFVPNQIPIGAVAELAQHPNIIAMKDSSGSVERIHATVAATANAPRLTVPVTQIFEAVTARMLSPRVLEAAGNFVFVGHLAGSAAVATAPPVASVKTRTREVGFQTLTGAEGSILAVTPGRSLRRHRRLCLLRAASLPGDLSGVEGPRPAACRRKAATHYGSRRPHRGRTRHCRYQARLRFQWLLWRPRPRATASADCGGKGRNRAITGGNPELAQVRHGTIPQSGPLHAAAEDRHGRFGREHY